MLEQEGAQATAYIHTNTTPTVYIHIRIRISIQIHLGVTCARATLQHQPNTCSNNHTTSNTLGSTPVDLDTPHTSRLVSILRVIVHPNATSSKKAINAKLLITSANLVACPSLHPPTHTYTL